MLINEPQIEQGTPILNSIAQLIGKDLEPKVTTAKEGIYFIGHFGSSRWPVGYDRYPQFNALDLPDGTIIGRVAYGVCDSVEQVLEHFPELENDPSRKFVLTLTEISRSREASVGGWRWCKWGPYIGTFEPQCEYFYDEVGIERVFVYRIYEKSV